MEICPLVEKEDKCFIRKESVVEWLVPFCCHKTPLSHCK